MSTDYAAIKDAVDGILKDAGVTFSAHYVGETTRRNDGEKPWQCDAWRVKLQARAEVFETDYFTGLGHRKARPGAPSDKGRSNTLYREEWEKRWLKPVTPRAADVLHSLLLDAQAADMSFPDWCSAYGYSDDSIKALETYRQCCDIGAQMRRVFDHKTFEALRTASRWFD